ncbi:MAG: M23 family metallopeptidase [Aquiluna sp.]|nr:M23 family metallopeptidase [Aquiluna sp.]
MLKIIAVLSIIFSSLVTSVPVPEIWAEPIPFFDGSLERDYKAPPTKYAAGHRGIDIKLAPGEAISAPADGKISFAGLVVDRDVVSITTNFGYLASFEPACATLDAGERVSRGQVIARHCEPKPEYKYHCDSCVHFSARNLFGYLSPMYLLGKLNPSVLTS